MFETTLLTVGVAARLAASALVLFIAMVEAIGGLATGSYRIVGLRRPIHERYRAGWVRAVGIALALGFIAVIQADIVHALLVRPAEATLTTAFLAGELALSLLWAVGAQRRYRPRRSQSNGPG